jgi:hypothetical protein
MNPWLYAYCPFRKVNAGALGFGTASIEKNNKYPK